MLALRENVGRGIAAWLRASGAGGVLLLGLCLSASEALADPDQPRTEYFTGFEVSDNYASGYVGAGYAFGKAGYAAPGFRLRAVGAYRVRSSSTAPLSPPPSTGRMPSPRR
jgi:hypothetical protein